MLARVRGDQQRFGEATALLDRLRDQSDLDHATLQSEAGRLLTQMQQYDRAAETLRQALASQPDNLRAHLYLGEVRIEQGKLRAARRHFQQAGRADRVAAVDQRREIARVLYEQAGTHQIAGDDAAAIRLYQQSRRIDAQQPQLLKDLALLLTATDDDQLRDPWLAEQLLRASENP
jgi:tetratricopeptide (TPR) repeat protein